MAGASFLAVVLRLLFYVGSTLKRLPNFLLLVGLCAAAFLVVLALTLLLGGQVLARSPARLREGSWDSFLGGLSVVLGIAALVYVSGSSTVRVLRSPSPPPSAVDSL